MKHSKLKQIIKEEIQKILNGESSNNIWDSYQMIIFDTLPSRETAKQRLQELAAIENPVNEKLNFMLGSTIDGDPNKPMKDDFHIVFKDPRKAIMTIMQVNKDLQARGLEPIEYENVGIVFTKPSNQQMQAILNAFNNQDVESVGRVL